LTDNVSYLAHVPEAAAVQEAYGQRLKDMAAVLQQVELHYVIGRHATSVATGGSLYQRLDGPGL